MKKLITLLFVVAITTQVNAKVWRINNNPGVTADFSDPQVAANSALVNDGDTLAIEASTTEYYITLRKRLVFIGLGYFIDGTASSNTGLQASKITAKLGVRYDSLASGSQFIGLEILSVYGQANSLIDPSNISTSAFAADNISFTRCFINGDFNLSTGSTFPAYIKADGWKLNKCYISGSAFIYGVNPSNWQITNCIFTSNFQMQNPLNYNCLIRNNYIGSANITNCYFANNLVGYSITRTNCTVKNNTSLNYNFFTDPTDLANNNFNDASSNVIVGGPIQDKAYQLKPTYESTAAADGETVNGITPKRGPFGTADPYRLSGIPNIPSIYTLTVPASVSNTATNMPVTISTQSNN